MTTTLVRSRTMLTSADRNGRIAEIADGAVLQEDGVILETGTYESLSRRFPNVPVLGAGNDILFPGFVNGHHHVGLTPLQLGSPDIPLELWFVTRMVTRAVSPYLDTLYSAFEMIASGVTTVQHLAFCGGAPAAATARAEEILRAYDDIGMRVSYSFTARDQNNLVYESDAAFLERLPISLRSPLQRYFDRFALRIEDHVEHFETLFARHAARRRAKVQLAPANLHWCSDKLLVRLGETARSYGVPLHMHLVETRYQHEYARRRTGGSAVAHLRALDLLGPGMTIGHGVWLSDADIELLARSGACLCHNCSSNNRLRSGVAPLNRLEAAGVTTAIGIDEAGINDDRDMLQEMRQVLDLHRAPGMEPADVPDSAQVFRMATLGGAATTPFAGRIGVLEPGMAADLVLMDWRAVAKPYLDPEIPLLDALIRRGRPSAIRLVMCDGEVIHRDGVATRVDEAAVLAELEAELAVALSEEEVARRQLSKALLPHVKDFYRGYVR